MLPLHNYALLQLFIELHWLPVKYRIQFKTAVFLHRVIAQRCPSYVADLDALHVGLSATTFALKRRLVQPSFNEHVLISDEGRCAFAVCNPDVGNSLPPSLRAVTSHSIFRGALKTHFLAFTFAICYRPTVCLSVCRPSSVILVRPTQAVEIIGNVSTAFGTVAIR